MNKEISSSGNIEHFYDEICKRERPFSIVNHKETNIGRFVITQDTLKIDGKEYPYSYETSADCVIVLPLINDRIILNCEYRHAISKWMLEIPAGAIERDENIYEAAKRELKEEAGYSVRKLTYYGEYPLSHGTASSCAHFFVAVCERFEGKEEDYTEFIENYTVSINEFDKLIDTGKYIHVAGIALWHLAKNDVIDYINGVGKLQK